MTTAIQFDGVSKQYRLGQVGTGTLSHDLERIWARMRGKPDPFAKVGQVNDRATKANGDGGRDSQYVWALRDISFNVKEGEILGIIGRNGAGKSTLLKLLSRVTAPTTGCIRARGRIASLLEVGTGFHPELTGRENIYLNGAILGMRRHEITRRLDEIIEFSGCAKYIDTPVKRYSSGMTVRLGFAVAAHLECEILVVDEVLAVGDAEFQKKCIDKMRDISSSGRTLLFVSHNLSSIQSLCGRACMLERGYFAYDSIPSNVIKEYLALTRANRTFRRTDAPPSGVAVLSAAVEIAQSDGASVMNSTIDVRSNSPQRVSVDLRISDASGSPVGFAPIGSFRRDHEIRLQPGINRITSAHDLGLLAHGSYVVSIDVADPPITYLDRVESCLTFDVTTPPTEGDYRRLDQKWGFGSCTFSHRSTAVEFISSSAGSASGSTCT